MTSRILVCHMTILLLGGSVLCLPYDAMDVALNSVSEVHPVCRQQPDRGQCPGWDTDRQTYRFFYSTLTKRCQPFLYNGCGGNSNRFVTSADCQFVCGIKMMFADTKANVWTGQRQKQHVPNVFDRPFASTPKVEPRVDCSKPRPSERTTVDDRSRTPEPRFYWNAERFTCLAYLPVNGVTKGSTSLSECLEFCQPMDGPACFVGAPGRESRTGAECRQNSCDFGYVCKHGAFFTTCCPAEAEEEATCPGGGKPFQVIPEGQSYGNMLMADTCAELTCPAAHHCVPGKYIAKCCPGSGVFRSPNLPRQSRYDMAPSWTAPRMVLPRQCLLPISAGDRDCYTTRRLMWAYQHRSANRCVSFLYSGCGGNENCFGSQSECVAACTPHPATSYGGTRFG